MSPWSAQTNAPTREITKSHAEHRRWTRFQDPVSLAISEKSGQPHRILEQRFLRLQIP